MKKTPETESEQEPPQSPEVTVQVPSKPFALAALLLFEDKQTDAEISRQLGISRRTLARWKNHPAMIRYRKVQEKAFDEHLDRTFREHWLKRSSAGRRGV